MSNIINFGGGVTLTPFKPEGKSYLTFSSPNSFTLAVNDATKHWDGTLEYFASDKTWTVWDGTTTLSSATTGSKNALYLRGTGNTVITGNNTDSIYKWVLTGTDISCIGNIENLLDYGTVETGAHPTMADYCYMYMFDGCKALTKAPSLPATTLASSCYRSMFGGCKALTQAPSLPATTLANECYRLMFRGCTSLTQAPALPATTLANECYRLMFKGCTSLTQVPALPATTLTNLCYNSMFRDCTSLKLSSSKTEEYTQEYRIPSSGTGTTATDALTDMFTSTGGAFTGTPAINTTYYLSSDNIVVRETEIATLREYVGSMIDFNSDVFIATYSTTTSAEIEAAYQAGKTVVCVYNGSVYYLNRRMSETRHIFSTIFPVSISASVSSYLRKIACISDAWESSGNLGFKPDPHSSTHASGGSDPITPASIGAATMDEVNAAIQTAIGNAIGGSY